MSRDVGEARDDDRSSAGSTAPARRSSWLNRLIILVVVIVALWVGSLYAAAALPTWWVRRVGEVADESPLRGVLAGLICGVMVTAVPLLLLRAMVRRHRRWSLRVAAGVLAALFAAPGLATLAVVLEGGEAARADRHALVDHAPGFAGATLAGAVLGAAGIVTSWIMMSARRRRRAELAALREELRRRDADPEDEDDVGPYRDDEDDAGDD